MDLQAKPHISHLPAPVHGGIHSAVVKGRPVDAGALIDFSTCLNPYGPSPAVKRALQSAGIDSYPDPESGALLGRLAARLNTGPSSLIAGSGSTELIRLAALAYLDTDDCAVTLFPTYGEYELACRIMNARVCQFPLYEQAGFRLDVDEFIAYSNALEPQAVFLCNPNNPTGQYLSFYDVVRIVDAFPSTLVILDEAYISFTEEAWDSTALVEFGNVLIVRSMTKDYGLAGLRLGYAVATPDIIQNMKKVRPPWNVSSPAQQAGTAALKDESYISRCSTNIDSAKRYLVEALTGLGYSIVPSQTNFFMVRVGDAAQYQAALLTKGFLVRDCTSFGCPEYIRIAPRRMQDCRRLVKAMCDLRS